MQEERYDNNRQIVRLQLILTTEVVGFFSSSFSLSLFLACTFY